MSEQAKKTVCLLGSPRRGGNSDQIANWFCDAAAAHGSEVKVFAVGDMTFSGCRNLFRCKTDLDHCGQTDALTPVLEAVREADVLVMASPIYFTTITGQLKLAMDRFFSFLVPEYAKVDDKSRLGSGRTLVFVQTQGEPESQYGDLLQSLSKGFRFLGFDDQHLLRAWGVREIGDVLGDTELQAQCESTAGKIYSI